MEQFVSLLVSLLTIGVALAVPSFKPVSLQYARSHICDGFIINKNWIITAAHCVEDLLIVETTQVLAGTNFLDKGGKIYNVTKAISHSAYDYISLKNDIALLKINEDIEFNDLVQPVEVGYGEANDTVTVAGWGEAEDTYFPEDLRYAKLKALSFEECQERAQNYVDSLYFGSEQVCALASNKAPCWGDSGGLLISNGKLVGIVSYAFRPCAKGVPDVYTRPSAYSIY